MTMTRQALLETAVAEYGDLADQAQIKTNTDTYGGWKGIIDETLRTLGTAETDLPAATVTDAQTEAALVLLEYFTLRRTVRALATKQNTTSTTVTTRFGQVYAQYKDRLEDVKAQVIAMGYGRAARIQKTPTVLAIPNTALGTRRT